MKTERYNNNKGLIKDLKIENKDLFLDVLIEISNLFDNFKINGESSKKSKILAMKSIRNSYPNCSYEIALLEFFYVEKDIQIAKIISFSRVNSLHKARSLIKKDNLTKNQIIDLIK